ncbi:CheY-like chemotaxis protein [Paraburkholderia sp. GAS448]|uniref:response regulator n=1 Tax=Paraburkholderia sp. GAS448 TaxID=3035136 RepID=UPI003D1DF3C1
MSTVLLVDDELENLWALQLALESEGHHVLLAESARDALGKLVREPANLIVTDLEMPEMDGAELCKRVRCQPAFAQLPIVLLSAAPEPADTPPWWSMYFRKPVDLSSLMRALDSFLAERLTMTFITLACSAPPASRWQPVDPRCWP